MDKSLRKDIVQWDIENWSRPVRYWEKVLSNEKKVLTCLEVGCREGGISLWLSLLGHKVTASDLSSTGETARPLHDKYSVTNKITYEDINALSIPYENHFDVIVFKSILGGIGGNNNLRAQELAIEQIYKALKKGGLFLFAENTSATFFHRILRKYFTPWGNSWRYVSLNEMQQFLIPFSNYSLLSTGFSGVLGKNENQKMILGKVDRFLFNRVFPKSWKYIMYGYARK